MNGGITLRKFRVMVENLPAGNPLEVARLGWPASRWMDWQVESRLRELIALTYNIHRGKNAQAMKVDYAPRPETDDEREQAELQAAYDAQMQAEMDRLFDRR